MPNSLPRSPLTSHATTEPELAAPPFFPGAAKWHAPLIPRTVRRSRLTSSAGLSFLAMVLLSIANAQTQSPQFTISTIAGQGNDTFSGDGGQAIAAGLSTNGVAADAAGNLYIVDIDHERIRKVAPNGIITTFAGTGAAGASGDGGPATKATLNQPSRVALDAAGNSYIADSLNNRVRKVAVDETITTVAGNGGGGNTGDGGPATGAQLNFIGDVTLDTSGNLFITTDSHVVRKVTPGGIISTVAGNGRQGFSGDGGPATSAMLNTPRGIAVNAAGELFISDQGNQRIRKVSNGVITTVAGTGTAGYSGDSGIGTGAKINNPAGISLDASGNLYIADRDNDRIRLLLANGNIFTVAGNGTAGFSGDGGVASSAAIHSPTDVAATSGGVYISDKANNRVRLLLQPPVITLSGVVPVFSTSTTIQPGSWISIYGDNLAATTTIWNGDFPTSLANTTVTIDGKPAYIWFVSPKQINVQAPDDTTTGTVPVIVTTPVGSFTSSVTLGPYGPSFSLFNGKYAAAIVPTSAPGNSGAGYDYIGPAGAFTFPSRPVKAGETIVLYGVGFGRTTPVFPAGKATSGAAQSVTYPQITIGGVPAQVAFAGIVEAGLFQFNVVVPPAPSGDQPLQATIGGAATPGNVYLTLQ
jgi:uncharacterized protein (TIGR03437 family)